MTLTPETSPTTLFPSRLAAGTGTPSGGRDPGSSFPTVKAFAIVEAIARAARPLGVSEINVLLGVPKPTAHRIMRSLETEGMLQREPGTRRYRIGPKLFRLGLEVVAGSVRMAPRHAVLESLSREIGETCNFGVMAGNHVVYLDRVEAVWPLGLRFEPGSKVPLHCTAMGKLFLSFLSPAQRRRLMSATSLHSYTENTITDPERMESELERIREAEVSADNQEFLAGVVCVAVPVRGPRGEVAAGLAVSAPLARMSLNRAMQHVPLLRAAAERMGGALKEAAEADATSPKRKGRG